MRVLSFFLVFGIWYFGISSPPPCHIIAAAQLNQHSYSGTNSGGPPKHVTRVRKRNLLEPFRTVCRHGPCTSSNGTCTPQIIDLPTPHSRVPYLIELSTNTATATAAAAAAVDAATATLLSASSATPATATAASTADA